MSKRVLKAASSIVFGLLLAACISVDPPRPDAPPHHRMGGYQNNHIEFEPRALTTLLRWKVQAAIDGLPSHLLLGPQAEARRSRGVDDERFFVLAVGETRRLAARQAPAP